MNPLKIFLFRDRRWYETFPSIFLLTISVSIGILVLAVLIGGWDFWGGTGPFGAFMIAAAGVISGGAMESRYDRLREQSIRDQLNQLGLVELVALSGSPEISERDQKIVISLLNQNHSGWSLSVPTVNSTR